MALTKLQRLLIEAQVLTAMQRATDTTKMIYAGELSTQESVERNLKLRDEVTDEIIKICEVDDDEV